MTASVMVDARWLGPGGVGSVSRMLLKGLGQLRPDGDWVVWGGADAAKYRWPGSRFVRTDVHPMSLAGHRSSLRVPSSEWAFFPHVIRPLTTTPSATIIHDTIPVRFARSRRRRAFWRAHFSLMAHASTRVLTDSEAAKRALVADTGVAPDRVGVLRLPVDDTFIEKVVDRRQTTVCRSAPYALYLGQIAPHKNLERLILAFGESAFGRDGGELRLVGGRSVEIGPLRTFTQDNGIRNVRFFGRSTDGEVVDHLAGASFLVMPSLEEGYGLPAVEAAAAGIPVVTSDIGPFRESLGGCFPMCDGLSVGSIRDALDEMAAMPASKAREAVDAFRSSRRPVGPRDFALQVVTELGIAAGQTPARDLVSTRS